MGAREDFMTVRRAAQFLSTIAQGEPSDPVSCNQRIMAKASAREAEFIRLYSTPVYAEIVDFAYAILAETRPEGPAADWTPGDGS
jgi:hypothetical protein